MASTQPESPRLALPFESVRGLLLELAREQNTMLLCVTHSQSLANRFPKRYELIDGKLIDTKQ